MIDYTCGDVSLELPKYPENTFDGCLCDPPYGLGFMGKSWDHGVPSVEVWREVLRVLKPGATLMAFGGTRTWHRLACAVEGAGFELRDTMMWITGQGFPKSLNLGNGYGTALKPAWEPILLAMKPLDGTFAENALKWGVAGLAIDACRIEAQDNLNGGAYSGGMRPTSAMGCTGEAGGTNSMLGAGGGRLPPDKFKQPGGRWPANLILDEEAAEMLDGQTGEIKSGFFSGHRNKAKTKNTFGEFEIRDENASRPANSGGASRFFYCAKASRKERGEGNTHPTVKPLALCTYLARLILPPPRDLPRCVLVPFAGSGSEAMGCEAAGWDLVVGIEKEPAYVEIAKGRVGVDTHP